MAKPATSWTGPAIVNGVLAIVLLVWLADATTRGAAPEPAPSDPVPKPTETPAAVARPRIVLPPPPPPAAPAPRQNAGAPAASRPTAPLRPPPRPEPKPAMEIEPLRAAAPGPPEIRAPLRPAEKTRPVETARRAEDAPVPAPAVQPAEPVEAEAAPPAGPPIRVDAKAVRAGRELLRIFEHGHGPGIEIAWPAGASSRERLHDVLSRCFGMRLALIDSAGALYRDGGPAGRPWHIDLDRYSGFVRRPSGRMTAAERGDVRRIARHHRGLRGAQPVRLFPRAVDAALLGGLAGMIGDGYRGSKAITATYRLRGGRVTIGDVRVDGRGLVGEIDLARAAAPACRRRGRI